MCHLKSCSVVVPNAGSETRCKYSKGLRKTEDIHIISVEIALALHVSIYLYVSNKLEWNTQTHTHKHTHTQRIQISTYTRSEHEGNSELSIHVLAVSRSCHNTPWTQVVTSNYLKSILVTQLISAIKPYFLRYVQELSLSVTIVGSECCFSNQKRGL